MCREHPTDWWFAGGHRDTILAKRICADCVVQPQCLEFALGRPELLGIWAATTPNERAALRRARSGAESCRTDSVADLGPELRLRGIVDVVLEAEPESEPESAPKPESEPAVPRPPRPRVRWRVGASGDRNELLTPAEAARLLGVTPNTVTRWSRAGKVSAIQTMGGHRRFRRSEVERVLQESNLSASTPI